jgi:hypothetical protein
VGEDALRDAMPQFSSIVGLDACILRAAFPDALIDNEAAIGCEFVCSSNRIAQRGSSTCVSPATSGRGEVTSKRGAAAKPTRKGARGRKAQKASESTPQIQVFGSWFKYDDAEKVRPIVQVVDNEAEEEDVEAE